MLPLSHDDPNRLRPKRAPSSSAKSISETVQGGVPASAIVRRASSAPKTPSAPSSQPPLGTESTCDPITTVSGRAPSRRAHRLPASSTSTATGSSPRRSRRNPRARSHSSVQHSRRAPPGPPVRSASARRSATARSGWTAMSTSAPPLEERDDVLAVRPQDALPVPGHEVDVELLHAVGLELPQLRDVILDRAEDAEAVAGLVVDELAVLRPLAAVGGVVVELAPGQIARQALREHRLVVAFQQVDDVVADHRREPPDGVAGRGHVVADRHRRADD